MNVVVGGVRLDALSRGVSHHIPKLCDGGPCPLHSQTDHHMLRWPQWHGRVMNLTVRECPHGALHPDPDDLRWGPRERRAHAEECDGCCTPKTGDAAGYVRLGGVDLGWLLPGVAFHSPKQCDGGPCPMHDPSAHHMTGWPQLHGAGSNLTVRQCPHGRLHPDPDDVRWGTVRDHTCDGCCTP